MSDKQKPAQPQLLRAGHIPDQTDAHASTTAAEDLRVSMVLDVLGGRAVDDVAHQWDIESSLLHRWVRDFLAGGTALVTHRPDPDEARQRDRFMAAFAHELRTPVAVARGWAMVLAEGDVPEDEVAAAHVRLSDALTRLSEHLHDVEMTASVSLGRIQVTREPVSIAGLCQELDGSPGVRHGADLMVSADPRLLRRVLRDLWATAHRDPAPDSVTIDVVETPAWHEIRVVRQGVPIGQLTMQALFDPFGANDDATGVTSGLYMARALTVSHGGFLGAEADDESTVLLARLPRETAADPQPSGQGSSQGKKDRP
jgi:signal transduction histidine kinase